MAYWIGNILIAIGVEISICLLYRWWMVEVMLYKMDELKWK